MPKLPAANGVRKHQEGSCLEEETQIFGFKSSSYDGAFSIIDEGNFLL